MSNCVVIWSGKPSYKRVIFRYNESITWVRWQNWKFHIKPHKEIRYCHCYIISPFFRLTKFNGLIEIGFGNHFLEIGW